MHSIDIDNAQRRRPRAQDRPDGRGRAVLSRIGTLRLLLPDAREPNTYSYMSDTAKTVTLTLRVLPEDRTALERAAKRDDRSVSSIVRIIIAEWRAKQRPEKRT
jgi:hypothetical protein